MSVDEPLLNSDNVYYQAAQQPRAGDAAGAAREPWRLRIYVPCCQPWRSRNLPAAHLTRIVGRSRVPTHRTDPSGQPDNRAEHT